MKISRFIKNALILAFISVFAGCSNLIDSKDDSATSQDANQGKFVVSLGLKSPGTRAIRAFDYSISDIARWTLTLTDESNSENIIMTTGAQTTENSPSAAYDGSAGTITATKIPAGTYTVLLEGSYTKETTDYTISGSAAGVAISADSSGKATILLGPKSTESGTGSISLTFTDSSSDKILSNLASSLKITLTNLSDNTKTFTYGPNSSSNTLTFDSSSLTLSGSGIKSGWYKISFSAGDTYRVYLPDEPSQFVEIADGTQTTATTAISAESGKVYYTNIGGKYNGFTENSRIDLNTLLANLTNKMPEEGNIFIHDDSSVLHFFDTDLLNSFKKAVGENKKKVIFYDDDGNETLIIGDNAGSTTTTLKRSVSFTSTDEAATFEINAFDLTENTMIFLSNGTMIDALDVNTYSSNYKLIFVLEASGNKNNFSAYNSSVDGSKPFLTAGADLSSDISLYDLENLKNATDYTVVTKSETTDGKTIYKHYVQAVGSGTITAESFAEKISVRAAYSSDTSTAYATSAAIPYTNGTLEFGLYEKTTSTSSDGTTTETYNAWSDGNAAYAWYLNGNALDSTTSTASFNPYQESNIKISETNTLSCKVTISGTTYVAEMSFTFTTTRSAAVWFDGINSTSSSSTTYALKQLADNTDTSTTASELVTATSSTLYCFDSSCNLWTGTYSETNSQLTTKKYSMIVSSGLFNTTHTGSIETIEISKGTPVDIYYDKTEENIFILATNGTTGYIYEDFYAPASFSLSSDSSVTPSQIAVSNGTIYIAGSDCNIYKSTVTLDYQGEDEDNCVILGDFTKIASLNSADVLGSNYTSSGNLSVTDLQVGDGSGNDTTTLYALLREYYIYSDGYTSNFSCYSRGALVAIDTSSSTATPSVYGWTDNTTPMSYSSSISGTLYGPGETTGSSSLLYGPTHFAAVVPKKLVILDDGVVYSTVGKVKNKDSLVEFDIDEKSLSRGASVSATAVIVSGFTVSD